MLKLFCFEYPDLHVYENLGFFFLFFFDIARWSYPAWISLIKGLNIFISFLKFTISQIGYRDQALNIITIQKFQPQVAEIKVRKLV